MDKRVIKIMQGYADNLTDLCRHTKPSEEQTAKIAAWINQWYGYIWCDTLLDILIYRWKYNISYQINERGQIIKITNKGNILDV